MNKYMYFLNNPTTLVAQTVKASAYNAGDPGSIPGSGRCPGEGNGNPLQCSCLENPMDGGAWLRSTDYSPWGCKESDTTERLHFLSLLLGRKVMTNLNSILKSRDITLPTKVHLVKAMVFPVVMYGCES